jgi:hypothetical protein
MTGPVRWEPYLWEEPHPVEPRELELLEQQWGVQLPEDYKRLVGACQGMTPLPCGFKVEGGTDAFCALLTVRVYENLEPYCVHEVLRDWAPQLPKGLYPFATTSGGEHLFFDYRSSPTSPKVVHVSVEATLTPVADSFQALLENLEESP